MTSGDAGDAVTDARSTLTHLRSPTPVPMIATMRLLIALLLVVGCSAESRELSSRPDSEPTDTGSAGETGLPTSPECQPVTCDAEVSSEALAYFTSPGCLEASRTLPVLSGDPVATWTLCDDTGRMWRTTSMVERPAAVWAGAECGAMPQVPSESFEWWAVVEVDGCR